MRQWLARIDLAPEGSARDRGVFWGLLALLLWAPLPLGSNRIWAIGILVAAAATLLMGAVWTWRHHKALARERLHAFRWPVATLGALWLMIAVICLATIDIGNVFWQKRELQKIADLAALAGASVTQMQDCNGSAQKNAVLNGAAVQDLKVECGNWSKTRTGSASSDRFVAGQDPFNASRVQVARAVPFLHGQFGFAVCGYGPLRPDGPTRFRRQ